MRNKKILLISAIVVIAIAAISGISYAAWGAFTSKPTGNWSVESNVPVDLAIGATQGDGVNYQGHDGSAPDGFFRSSATVEITATRDIVIRGVAHVTAKKDGKDVSLENKVFEAKFIVEDADADTISLTKDALTSVNIIVIFPDLSDLSFQGCEFTIMVELFENK